MFAFNFFTFLTAFQLFPTIPFRVMALGGSKAQAGLFLAIYTYACAFTAPITGSIADHVGRRRLLLIGSSAFVVFSMLYGVVTSLPLLLVIACIHGTFWSAIMSSGAAIISEIIPESRRTEGIAYWGMASTAAVAVAPLIGLTLYRISWGWLCTEIVMLSLVMCFMALRVRGGLAKSDAPFPRITEIVEPRVLALAMALFVVSFSYGGITSYVAILAQERKIIPSSIFFTVFAVTILITRLVTARFGDRIGPRWLLFPALALIPLSLVVLALSHSRTAIICAAILFGSGFGNAYPAFVSFVLGRTSALRRGATFGSILLAFDTGIGTGSLLTGIAVQRYGFTFAYLAAAVVSTLSIPIFELASRTFFREEAGEVNL